MRGTAFPVLLAGLSISVLSLVGAQPARADLQVEVRAGPAPPPPTLVFRDRPEVVLIPSSRVYYVPKLKYDLFRYGRYWYINNKGYWYRARSYRGPFESIRYTTVPKTIKKVPDQYHKHPLGGPPSASRAVPADNQSKVTPGQIGTKKKNVKKDSSGSKSQSKRDK